jgi:hypothetical protein
MNPDGYELFCNRDESRTRKPALPPTLQRRAGVRFIAPTDADAGGSWIAVNEFGLALCLLNYYPADGGPRCVVAAPSRGLLLVSLIDSRSGAEAAKKLRKTSLESYRPFLLLVLEPSKPVVQHAWDGRTLSSADAQLPITTSSFDTANVIAARRAKFAELHGEAYHMSRDERGGAYSVCMSRDDAQTVSFSHVIVSAGEIEFRYRARVGDGFGNEEVVRV